MRAEKAYRRRTIKRAPVIVGGVVHIPLTKGRTAIVDLIDADLGQLNWRALQAITTCYAARRENGDFISLHRVVAQRAGLTTDGFEVDHIDCDGLNCRRSNLRSATTTQNKWNSRLSTRNKSGVKGVWHNAGDDTWHARIMCHSRSTFLGRFASRDEAAAAYARAAVVMRGEFARLA